MISFTGHNRRLREKLKIERIIAKRNEEGEERGREKTEIHKYLINNSQKEIWAGFLQNTKF